MNTQFDNKSLNFNKIDKYNAKDVIPFCKGTDTYNGIQLKLGNMLNCFPVTIFGHTFANSEIAYICGYYGTNSVDAKQIQCEIEQCKNGMMAKRIFRYSAEKVKHARADFNTSEWRSMWMFYIVWNKVMQNEELKNILMSLPTDKILIENGNNTRTGYIWGCKNTNLKKHFKEINKQIECDNSKSTKKHIKELQDAYRCDLSNHFGIWEGYNVMGKILMFIQKYLICKQQNNNSAALNIDYKCLNDAEIYWFGTKLIF